MRPGAGNFWGILIQANLDVASSRYEPSSRCTHRRMVHKMNVESLSRIELTGQIGVVRFHRGVRRHVIG
jgi:hypothetical protein